MAIFLACKHDKIIWDCYDCNKTLWKCKYCGEVTGWCYKPANEKDIVPICVGDECDMLFKLEFWKKIEEERK